MFADDLRNHEDTAVEDKIVVLRGLRWSDYQRQLELRGERSVPRFAYLEGDLEIMTPSRPHESLKSRIGQLVEAWCLAKGIEFSAYGAWTLEDEATERGVEADECYVFGIDPEALRPHLAIEVVWTSGGIRKLAIYQKLGVKEVWFWRKGRITIHILNGEQYLEAAASGVLAGIDLVQLCTYLARDTASQGIREYREALNQPKP